MANSASVNHQQANPAPSGTTDTKPDLLKELGLISRAMGRGELTQISNFVNKQKQVSLVQSHDQINGLLAKNTDQKTNIASNSINLSSLASCAPRTLPQNQYCPQWHGS